jgi:formate dehydrogenase subunit delta
MSPDKMIYMANQIATFFHSQKGPDQAARVAAHIKDFWEPRMLTQFYRVVAGEEVTSLPIDPLVREAARQLQTAKA